MSDESMARLDQLAEEDIDFFYNMDDVDVCIMKYTLWILSKSGENVF